VEIHIILDTKIGKYNIFNKLNKNIMKEVNKETLNNKFIEKYFPFKKEHTETGISLIDYLKSKTKK
jgi:hypothetical protein